MSTPHRTRSVVAAVSVIAALAVTSHASAESPRPHPSPSASPGAGREQAQTTELVRLKARGDTEISKRLNTLKEDASRINNARELTDAHKATLSAMVSRDQSGLQALNTKIQADSDIATARNDVQAIVTQYRVYVLLEPQIHLTIAADRAAAVDTKLRALAGRLETMIANSKAPSDNIAKAKVALADLNSKIAASSTAISPVAAEVLALTPAGYPGNKATLQSADHSLHESRQALKGARQDVDTVLQALRTAKP